MTMIIVIMTSTELGQSIRQRRKQLHITQGDLARLALCSKPSVIAAEGGKPTLRLDVLMAILQVIGLTLSLQDSQVTDR